MEIIFNRTGQVQPEPVFVFHTHSNTDQISMYPARSYPQSGDAFARFRFTTPSQIHLYCFDAHPSGMGVVRHGVL